MGACGSTGVNPHLVDESHFERRRVMGQEAWSKTYLAEAVQTGELVALKEFYKDELFNRKLVDMVRNERSVLGMLAGRDEAHPFTQRLAHAFQTRPSLYLVLPFSAGGSLEYRRKAARKHKLDEASARFYVAEVLVALEALHAEGLVHRDVRPRRVLIDAEGHAVLSFFGRAKRLDEGRRHQATSYFQRKRSHGFTPPEVRAERPYSFGVDVWGLGCLAFVLMHNMLPDSSALRFSTKLSAPCVKFLAATLEPSPSRRIDLRAARAHPWFRGIDWDAVQRRELTPPWVPAKGQAYFPGKFDAATALLEDEDAHTTSKITAEQHRAFQSWNFNLTPPRGGRARRRDAKELIAAAAARERREEEQSRLQKERRKEEQARPKRSRTAGAGLPSSSSGRSASSASSAAPRRAKTLKPRPSAAAGASGHAAEPPSSSEDEMADYVASEVSPIRASRAAPSEEARAEAEAEAEAEEERRERERRRLLQEQAAAGREEEEEEASDDHKEEYGSDDDKESLHELDVDVEYDGRDK